MAGPDDKKNLPAPWQGKVVLVVDDYPTVRKSIRDILTGLGVQSLEAENGLAALEIMKTKPVDLVFSDLVMPEMDGFELIEALRAGPQFRRTPVITISTHADAKYTFRALKLGADDYLTKPPSPEMVKVVLARMFNYEW